MRTRNRAQPASRRLLRKAVMYITEYCARATAQQLVTALLIGVPCGSMAVYVSNTLVSNSSLEYCLMLGVGRVAVRLVGVAHRSFLALQVVRLSGGVPRWCAILDGCNSLFYGEIIQQQQQ